jgi:two-component system sensor histidine kinase QseC
MLSFVLLLGAGSAGIYFSTRAALVEQFDNTLQAKANAVVSGTEAQGDHIDVELDEQSMHEYDEGVPVDFFQLRRIDGSTLWRSKSLTNADLPARFGTFRHPKYWNLTLSSGFEGRAVGYSFSLSSAKDGQGPGPADLSIIFASDRRDLDEGLSVLAVVLLGCGVLMLLATAFIVPRVLRQELAPLDRLAEEASRIDANSLSTRFPIEGVPGELQPIYQRLNHLLSRLEESFERERRFSADLAHELRTPIAELRSLAEVALRWPESRPGETDKDTFAIALQMEGIVTRLLELLRSERGQVLCRRETVSLFEIVESVWRTFKGKVEKKALKVVQNVPRDLQISSDSILLRSILTNLVDNAVEYTPAGGTITTRAEGGHGEFKLEIANAVEHLDARDLPKLFDRFWRKDPSRTDAVHAGLGLSLAHAFSKALETELTASFDGSGHLVMTLKGPTSEWTGSNSTL